MALTNPCPGPHTNPDPDSNPHPHPHPHPRCELLWLLDAESFALRRFSFARDVFGARVYDA